MSHQQKKIIKVLLYWEGAADGGSEAILESIAKDLLDTGNKIVLANCCGSPSPLGQRWQRMGERYLSFFAKDVSPQKSSLAKPSAEFFAWWDSVLEGEKPDVLLVNNGGYPWHITCLAAVQRARVYGIERIIFAVHSTPETVVSDPDERLEDQRVAMACDLIVVGSESIARTVAEARPELASRLFVIQYGVKDPGPRPKRNDAELVVLGMASEMRNSNKGHLVLLDALERLSMDLPWECRLAGDGPFVNTVRKEISRRQLPIRLLGRVPESEMESFYNELDIYVMPSFHEGLSLTIIEAMAHQLPVVTTNVGGHRDAVSDGKNGFLVPQRNAVALGDVLERLLHSPKLRDQLGRNGRQVYEQHFTLNRYLLQWKDLIQGSFSKITR